MLRDLIIFSRNPAKIPPAEDHNENLPVAPPESFRAPPDSDPSRPPLNTIQDPLLNPKPGSDQEPIVRRKIGRTPSKKQIRPPGMPPSFPTPEKPATARGKFGWAPKSEAGTNSADNGDDPSQQGTFHLLPPGRGGYSSTTPRMNWMGGKASSVRSDCSLTQITPTKSVVKPTYSGFSSNRPPLVIGQRIASFSAASKGMPMSSTPPTTVNVAAVPHFELKEDPSFWLDHNVQVVIRVRPLNSMEQSLQGHNRCLKQESANNVTWIGQPETRFTFDYVACETINQEMLFRVIGLPMVENCMSGYNSCMFGYGQTGSGKTFTMLGEIGEMEIRLSPDRGMSPRIFEFLFARIRAEEDSRTDEKLKYNCKCSFLEIYNEQITDLLNPSSTNLLLREDVHKGVYVENLSEFEVEAVNDVLKLLIQGAANRKVAATNMNRESSRSHSVFTCVIESRWEKDSTTNLRFSRLNLVDLAGSERQKTSGAEGERLKEAANINKSLSTLGHVIMILADVAHGKQRHIPYRDSRLTFLLQDSLGGNSKTVIMANVSPSICSSNETLSTLKFAQRAKLIQNNAVVNEDASGDILALQHQIRLLKEELSVLKCQNLSRSLSFRMTILEDSDHEPCHVSSSEKLYGMVQMNADKLWENESSGCVRVSAKQEAAHLRSASSIRDNEFMDTELKRTCQELENCTRDIDNLCIELNNIQSSSDDQHVKIEPQSMEFCLASSQRDFRDQTMRVEWKPEISMKHAEEILNLQLELDILKIILGEEKSAHAEAEERAIHVNCELKVANETIFQINQYNEDLKNELKDARSIIESIESQHMTSLNELENLRENNIKYTELLKKKEQEISILRKQLDGKLSFANEDPKGHLLRNSNFEDTHLQLKLKRVQASLEKACSLNLRYQSDLASQTSIEQEMEEIRRQVEVETAEVIVCLQEELMALQQQVDFSNRNELLAKQSLAALETETKGLDEKLCLVTQDNERLGELVKDKERDIKSLTDDWERLACEVADVLADGNAVLDDASGQVAFISDSFPHKSWISEQLGRMIESISKRDASIIELQNCLEDAQNVRCDMEQKLRSLRGATLAITEVQQQETSEKEKEILLLTSKISEKDAIIVDLESRINTCEEQIRKAEICATVAFMTVNRLSEKNRAHFQPMDNVKVLFNESTGKSFQKDELPQDHISLYADGVKQIQAVKLQLEQSKEHDAQLKHYQEREQTEALDYKRKKEEDVALSRIAVDLLKAKRMINEIKVGVYTLHSCMSEFSEHICSSAEVHNSGNDSVESADYNHEDLMEIKSLQNVLNNEHHNIQTVPSDSIENPVGNNIDGSEGSRLSEGTFGRETTIFLVRKEIEYALDSLQEVQDQMVKLRSEKEEMKKSEIQSQKTMEHLSDELLQLKSDIIAKEQQFEFRLLELEHKLQTVEGNAIASNECLHKAKEVSKRESEQATIGPTNNAISSGGSCR